jgi:hypothetical protein
MRDALHSGDDSGLVSTWDEICAQVQGEHSIFWDAYEDVMDRFVAEAVRELKPYQLEAVWLQTVNGEV